MSAPGNIADVEFSPDDRSDYVSTGEALRILGVKPQTLYSYVSRGLIRRVSLGAARTSYYSRQDLQRLRARSEARSGHGAAAASALHWGEPVLTTAITEITPNGPRYRDHLAVDLARSRRSFESVAEYLWTGRLAKGPNTWHVAEGFVAGGLRFGELLGDRTEPRVRDLLTQAVLLQSGGPEGSPSATTTASDCVGPRNIIRGMAGALGILGPDRTFVSLDPCESIAHGVARALGVAPGGGTQQAVNAMLVLTADHEFTPATFVARIAASVGSDLQACLIAALQAHFGSVLGLCCDRLEDLLDSLSSGSHRPADLEPLRASPGFDHPLYLQGDPRAKLLLEMADAADRTATSLMLDALEQYIPHPRQHPNLCESLVVLCRVLGLPRRSSGGLLALARSAGWIAHVLEQRQQGFIIRPRGKFVAAPPDARRDDVAPWSAPEGPGRPALVR